MKARFVLKYCLAVVINIIPFLLCSLLYRGGAYIILFLFPLLQLALAVLNFVWTKKIISLLFLDVTMLVSSVIGNELNTIFYYNNISSDAETLMVGSVLSASAVLVVGLLTVISMIIRIVVNYKN